VSQSAIYVSDNDEAILISYWDTEETDDGPELYFYGTGEESGEEYRINYTEVDLQNDRFYKLVLLEPPVVDKTEV